MPTSQPEVSLYSICAWSELTQGWITTKACSIPDTEPNWVSHLFIQHLIKEVPPVKSARNTRPKVPPEATFTWCTIDDNPREHKSKRFQIRARAADSPCDLGIQKCLLRQNEPVAADKVPVSVEKEHRDEIPNEIHEVEEEDSRIESEDQKRAREWFKNLRTRKGYQDVKVNIFEDGEVEPSSEKARAAEEWFREVENRVHPHVILKNAPKDHSPPKIAILDTGVDERHSAIIACLENFKGPKSFTDGETQDYHDHGTFIASLILKVVPQVHLYVAKVAEKRLLPLVHSVADAIRWAVREKVDIITMSFGMENSDDEVDAAIHEAYNQNIIIFAAASNGGGNLDFTYPANNAEVIAIYATDGKGNKSDFNPNPGKWEPNFSILGEGITSSWTTYENRDSKQHTKTKSGTSYATPIAAGIAALILDFAKINEVNWYKKLHTPNGMSNVFGAMAADRDRYDYVCPWRKVFGKGCTSKSILKSIGESACNH